MHGAWHGAWAWAPMLPALRARGLEPVTVDLPSAHGDGDLRADVAVVRAALLARDEPTLLVGHSYGGMVITEAGAGVAQVAGLVYVCAFLLDVGQSVVGLLDGGLPSWQRLDAERGLIRVADPVPTFYGDLDPDLAATWSGRLGVQTVSSFAQPLTAAAWRHVPSVYVVAGRDAAIPPGTQRAMARRATAVVELDSAHSPFASHPDALAGVVAEARVRPVGPPPPAPPPPPP